MNGAGTSWYYNSFFATFTPQEVASSELIWRIYFRNDCFGDTPGAGPFTALTGDVDGNGTADVILNRLTSSTNVVAVARGTTSIGVVDGTVTPTQTHDVATNWNAALPVLVGDVNFDGRADVVWVIPGAPTRVFLARSRAN